MSQRLTLIPTSYALVGLSTLAISSSKTRVSGVLSWVVESCGSLPRQLQSPIPVLPLEPLLPEVLLPDDDDDDALLPLDAFTPRPVLPLLDDALLAPELLDVPVLEALELELADVDDDAELPLLVDELGKTTGCGQRFGSSSPETQ